MKRTMRTIMIMCFLFAIAGTSFAATYDSYVQPEGDAVWTYDRGGGWVDQGWGTEGTGNTVSYWYGSPSLSSSKTYLQVAIPSLGASEPFESAYLNLYITGLTTGLSNGAANLYHIGNSSGANGTATQKLTNDLEHVLNFSAQSLGWNAVDVSSFIENDISEGYSYAAFYFDYVGYGDWGPATNLSFSSGSDPVNAAFLQVNTSSVPEPVSMVLFGIGGATIAFARRKKK